MATSRYVALTPIRHNGKLFAVGDALALTDAQAASLGSAIAPQAGALPAMPPDPPVPVLATPSESGRTYFAGGIDITDELTAGGGGGTLASGTYICDVGTRTWTGTIKPAILTLTPGAGGTAYIEATEDGTIWVAWSEGVVSAATTARLAGPVVGLRVISTVTASTLGVVA